MSRPAADGPVLSPVLECRGVSKYFGAVRAVSEVSLSLYEREIVALLGDNGAGKSTLVKIISGVYPPDTGDVLVNGEVLQHFTPRKAHEKRIRTVHQHLALCDNLNAPANVMLGQEPVRFAWGPLRFVDRRRSVEEARRRLKDLGIELNNESLPVRRFSGGQRQAIAIARADVLDSLLIMFDEPTAALGVRQTKIALDLIRRVRDQGRAVLVVSHNMEEVFDIADRIIVLRLGRLVLDGSASDITPEEAVMAMTGIRVGANQSR